MLVLAKVGTDAQRAINKAWLMHEAENCAVSSNAVGLPYFLTCTCEDFGTACLGHRIAHVLPHTHSPPRGPQLKRIVSAPAVSPRHHKHARPAPESGDTKHVRQSPLHHSHTFALGWFFTPTGSPLLMLSMCTADE
jgi:hypothetical protein